MPKSLSLEPKKTGTKNRPWMLWIPARLSPTGKDQRLCYLTKEEANRAAAALVIRKKNYGNLGTTLSASQIALAGKAFQLLGDRSDTLLEIIIRHLDAEKRLGAIPGAKFEDAIDAHITTEIQRLASRPFGEAYAEFQSTKAGRGAKHKRGLRLTGEKFAYLDQSLVSDITPGDLWLTLKELPLSTRRLEQAHLKTFFNFAIKRDWRALGTNPIDKLDVIELENGEVEVFSVDECEKLLNFALANDLALLPFLIFTLFCGIRSDVIDGEISKLQWSDVHLIGDRPEVVIRPNVSKTRRRRFVELSENALAWIEVYRQQGGIMEGPVVTYQRENLRNHRRKAQAGAGIERWVQAGARHSFCSYWLAAHKDVNRLTLMSGHNSADVMWRHYYRGATETEAKKFWSILPPAELINVIPIKKAQKTV